MARTLRVERFLQIALGTVCLFSAVVVCRLRGPLEKDGLLEAESSGAISGRIVQVPGKEYRQAFKAGTPKLGDCALKMGDFIQFCKEQFGGDEVLIPKASTVVDVSRVQSTEDILNHIMGALGVSVGVLGLASVDVKVKVAVTTETSATSLNLMSSYEVQRGILTLQNAHPTTPVGPDGTLFLSEIQLGGNEVFLVTMDFESEAKKTEVEVSVKVKILFITISAKMRYVKETFKTASSVRVQFISSWRGNIDKKFGFLGEDVIKEVERIEEMYMTGPTELSKMDKTDERLHNAYSFAAWNRGPYGESMNQATINADLESLKQQNAEVSSVIERIKEFVRQAIMSVEKRTEILGLNATLAPISEKLTKSLETYHMLSAEERNELSDIYGTNLAPLHYERKFSTIVNA